MSGNVRADEAPFGEGPSALPGFVHTGVAAEREPGFAARASLAYGITESVGAARGPHHRFGSSLGISGQPLRWLGVGLTLDARGDVHPNDPTGPDRGVVTDGALEVRATPAFGDGLAAGGRVGVAVVGDRGGGPSLSATSTTLTGLASFTRGRFLVAGELGYRIDRSDRVAPNAFLSPSDRLSLGVSSADAVLLRIAASERFGSNELFLEASFDVLVGKGAPSFGRSPMHAVVGYRKPFARGFVVDAFVDLGLSSRPALPALGPYVAVDPRLAVGVALAYRWSHRPDASDDGPSRDPDEADASARRVPEGGTEPEANARTSPSRGRVIEGLVLDSTGHPLVDAHVVVTIDHRTFEGYTDANGAIHLDDLPRGDATIRIEAVGHVAREVVVGDDTIPFPPDGIRLAPSAPHGFLRGTVRGFDGESVPATITITPSGSTVRVDAEGAFELPLAPGRYRVRITADGFTPQSREMQIANGGVTILHVELRAAR